MFVSFVGACWSCLGVLVLENIKDKATRFGALVGQVKYTAQILVGEIVD